MPTLHDYKEARRLAVNALKGRDMEALCLSAGVALHRSSEMEGRVQIPFLQESYTLHFSQDDIAFDDEGAALSVPDQVLLLHYLADATGAPMENRWITFREVPSGSFYYSSFLKRAVVPLISALGHRPDTLDTASGKLGKRVDTPGDVALKVDALPRVPLVLALWKGDDEFPADGNVYFDASVSSYLGTEDIAYIAGATVYRILNIVKNLA